MREDMNYKLVRHMGSLSESTGETVKMVSVVQWADMEPSLDIRKWENDEPKKGISLRGEEIRNLCQILKYEFPEFF